MGHELLPVIGSEQIRKRVRELGREISHAYANIDQPLVTVCVLKGAVVFFADLIRCMSIDPVIDFVRVASYGQGTSRQDQILLSKDLEVDIAGREVLIVEDIVDTAHSVRLLKDHLQQRKPSGISTCALVDKHERREVDVQVDFCGFRLEKGFIVGYGMDYAEQFRHLDGIFELKI